MPQRIVVLTGAGVSADTPLAELYASVRTLRIADGPDEVHNRTIARLEYGRFKDKGCGNAEP